jgi:hypothetical protein
VADMQWAVEHDYRLCHELTDAMKRQRKVRAVRRRAGETQRVVGVDPEPYGWRPSG